MLRLIDIVLILLFGFISISHFDRALEVDLPRAAYLPRLQPDFASLAVVSVDANGAFVCGMESRTISEAADMRAWLAGEKASGATQVRLRCNRLRPSGEVALLQDVCEELELGLTLEIVREPHAEAAP